MPRLPRKDVYCTPACRYQCFLIVRSSDCLLCTTLQERCTPMADMVHVIITAERVHIQKILAAYVGVCSILIITFFFVIVVCALAYYSIYSMCRKGVVASNAHSYGSIHYFFCPITHCTKYVHSLLSERCF
jgi:hypothetical protein